MGPAVDTYSYRDSEDTSSGGGIIANALFNIAVLLFASIAHNLYWCTLPSHFVYELFYTANRDAHIQYSHLNIFIYVSPFM